MIKASKEPMGITLDDISAEVARARTKFPGNRHLAVALGEEYGELCKALLQGKRAEVRAEAVQVACVAIRIIEEQDASFDDWAGQA